MLPDLLEQHLGGRILGEEHRRGTDRERKEEVGAGGVAEVELGYRQRDVVRSVGQRLLRVALGRVGKGVVALHDSFGPAGGAARKEPERRVVGVGGDRFELLFARCRGLGAERSVMDGVGADDQQPRPHRGAFARRLEGGDAVTGDHRRPRAAVVEQFGYPVALERGVDHHRNGARLQDAEERADELGAVRQGDQHPLLAPDVEATQRVGESVGEALYLVVGRLAPVQAQRDTFAQSLDDACVEEALGDVESLVGGGHPVALRFGFCHEGPVNPRWTRTVPIASSSRPLAASTRPYHGPVR